MAIAITIENFLKDLNIHYDLIHHAHSSYSMQSAEEAHISGNTIAKSIMLEDAKGRVMANIPASRRLDLKKLNQQLQRNLHLSAEHDLGKIFLDCEPGAVPAVGAAYGVETVIDSCLDDCCDVYFEGGDHTDLVHVTGSDFRNMQKDSQHGRFSKQI